MNCAEFIRFVRRRSSGAKRLESPKDVLSDASEMGVRRSAARIADSIFEKEAWLLCNMVFMSSWHAKKLDVCTRAYTSRRAVFRTREMHVLTSLVS